METYANLDSNLASRLMSAANSTLYTDDRRFEELSNALLWAYGYHEWPETVRGKITSTAASSEYYDYPSEFRTDSIIRVVIDDTEHEKVDFQDYLDYKKTYATDLQTISAGTSNFDVWGCIQPELPISKADTTYTTIFSGHASEANEAIVKKALSVLIAKVNKNLAMAEEAEARAILDQYWKPIAIRQQHKKRLEHPMFDVPDFYGAQTITYNDDTQKYIFADYQRKIFIASFS